MFGSLPARKDARCACGRDSGEAAVTTFRSVSGTYRFHCCPCGMEWTEHVPAPARPIPASGDVVLEFHHHVKAFHGLLRGQVEPQADTGPHWRPAAG
jgi:hypothetical protein